MYRIIRNGTLIQYA